jgi:hypothetical protein
MLTNDGSGRFGSKLFAQCQVLVLSDIYSGELKKATRIHSVRIPEEHGTSL